MHERKKIAIDVLGDNLRVERSVAARCLSLAPSAVDDWVRADVDGLYAADDVLAAVDRRIAAAKRDNHRRYRHVFELARIGSAAWEVHLGDRMVGEIGVRGPESPGPLATPVDSFCAFYAAWPTGRGWTTTAAVNAFAAQCLIAQEQGYVVAGEENVRPWGEEEVAAAAHVLAGGTSDVLTPWEHKNLVAISNPDAHHYRMLVATRGPEAAEDWLLSGVRSQRVATPEPLTQMRRMDGSHLSRWNTTGVADFLLVSPSTVRSWLARGQMPDPDGRAGGKPWWTPETIKAWDQQRPGRGGRKPTPTEK